jgi:GH24 family phage-related lysozyme (muramidase)
MLTRLKPKQQQQKVAQPAPAPDLRSRGEAAPRAGNQASLLALSAVAPKVQPKLVVGAADDPLEHEADRVATQVMGMRAPPAGLRGGPVQVSRKCAACNSEDDRQTLRAKQAGPGGPATGEAPAIVQSVLRQPGQALDPATRGFFEPRIGADLGSVRVHTEAVASDAARSVGAHAFTVGERIVFAEGAFAPASSSGRRLLAHELAHVVQQRGGLAVGRVQRDEDAPKVSKVPDKICDPPTGTPKQPSEVSSMLLDRMMGKVAGDPGEGCKSQPYPASNGEKVCTYGYGHQIQDCPIVNKKTGAAPNKDEVNDANKQKPRDADNPYDDNPRSLQPDEWLTCQCAGKKSIGCPDEAAALLKTDANSKAVPYIRKNLPLDLTQAQFDAFADLTLHRGSIEPLLLDAAIRYWCTKEGRNYVRDLYLGTSLSAQGSDKPLSAFAARRQMRVWPVET